jgi:hypothetical protein
MSGALIAQNVRQRVTYLRMLVTEYHIQDALVDACLIEETLIDKTQENYWMIDSLSIWLESLIPFT